MLGLTSGYGILGFIDDYHKVTKGNSDGISARMKLFWQVLLAFGVAIAIYTSPAFDPSSHVPFFKNFTPHLGWLYVPFATFVIVAACNAVNLTDGLDGLAIGPVMISAGTFLLLAYAAGHAGIAEYLPDHARPRRRRSSRSSAARSSAAASAFSGSTPTRRSSSWATSARSPSEARSERSPS